MIIFEQTEFFSRSKIKNISLMSVEEYHGKEFLN